MDTEYRLGNCLRGYFHCRSKSLEEAWQLLSQRFLLSYPSETGRRVQFYVNEENKYGLMDWIMAKDQDTSLDHVYEDQHAMNVCYQMAAVMKYTGC